MAIFTAEQLKQKFAGQLSGSMAAPAPAAAPSSPGFMQGVSSAFGQRHANVQDVKSSTQSGASKVLQTLGQGAGLIGDVAVEGLKAVTPDVIEKPVTEAIGGAVQGVAQTQTAQDILKSYQSWKSQHPEAAANLEAAGLIASLVPIGGGATVAGKGAATAAGTAVKGAGSTVSVTGRALKGAGAALNNTAFTPNMQAAERILNYEARAPFLTRVKNTLTGVVDDTKPRQLGDTAREKGLMGTERMVGVQAKREADKLWKEKIAPAVKGSDVQMTKDELFAPAQAVIDKTVDPTRKKALQDAFDALTEDYADFDAISLDTAQALKRDLDKFTPGKMFRGQDVSAAVKTLQHEMADAIRQKTYDVLDNKKDYLDWANLDALSDVGVKAISEARLKGGFGGFWSAMWDMTTTPIKTIGGQTLYRVGNALEFTGEKGIKRFGDFLKSKGFQRTQDLSSPTTMQMSQSTNQTPKKKVNSSMTASLAQQPQSATRVSVPSSNGSTFLGKAKSAINTIKKEGQKGYIKNPFAPKPNKPNGDSKLGSATSKAWPTTASKPSKAGSTSTGSAPTGKGGVSAQRAGTSGPFEGGLAAEAKGYSRFEDFQFEVLDRKRSQLQDKLAALNPKTDLDAYAAVAKEISDLPLGAQAKALWERAQTKTPTLNGDTVVEFTSKKGNPVSRAFPSKRDAEIWVRDAHKLGINDARLSSPSIPKELEPLAAEARKYKSAEEFRKAVNQKHLMDLSDHETHRWGRAFTSYADEPLDDISDIIKNADNPGSYLSTMKFSNPIEYKAITAPGNEITIYRAVPKNAGDEIRIGDYVALDKKYAQMHLDSVLKGEQKLDAKLVSTKVPKADVVWGGADFTEWAYSPRKLRDQFKDLTDFYNKVKGGK